MTTPFLVKFVKIINTGRRVVIGVFACLLVSASLAETPNLAGITADESVVGSVSMLLGKAYRIPESGPRELIKVGTQIRVHDQILTETNGHVHVRFVDDALVSVRPGSRLEIVRYEYNPDQPANSTVKFDLQEGVTRAISGKAAKSARERFRLNTPIAAIGVRGTDFVVRATEETVRALVNEGVIVVAPYSSECAIDAFGPCASNAVELTENSLQIIELDQGDPLPVLLPAQDQRSRNGLGEQVQIASTADQPNSESQVAEKTAGTEVYLENVTSNRVTADVAKAAQVPPSKPADPDFTPAALVASAELAKSQLVWGRWSAGLGGQERISMAYSEAAAQREVTVGNAAYALFRPENGSIVIDKGLGVVSFSLSSAQAYYTDATSTSAMRVASGNLNINFDQNRFATDLNLSHSATGDVLFAAEGRISEAGYFNNRTPEQTMAGAVSIDGTEAGYFFEKQLLNGGIQGLTLWNSK